MLLLITLLCLSFSTGGSRSQYTLPIAAWSVTAGDIYQDGENDIVVGHKTAWEHTNPTISILKNIDNGIFEIVNTTKTFCGYQENILLIDINNDSYPDIVAFRSDFSSGEAERYVRVFYNFLGQFNTYQDFSLNSNDIFSNIDYGDINGDNAYDLVVASNHGQFWGVLYNDGNGSFSDPEYHYVGDYHPMAITCGDLNDDGRDDIVVCGGSTEVYFSYPDGFQLLTLETGEPKDGVSIVDFDLDEENDLLTFIDYPIGNVTGLVMYQNQGNNILDTLDQLYFSFSSSNYFVTDFNNDSLKDILFQLGDYTGYVIYYNQGNFQLADSQFVALPESDPPEVWRNCYCADMDGNGYNDIITVKTLYAYLPNNLEILFNDGHGHFLEDPITTVETQNSKLKTQNLICYPNPFRDRITIEYTISKKEMVEVGIYNMSGQKIKTLNKGILQAGKYTHTWDGTDKNGKVVSSGIYIIRLTAGRQTHSCRIMYMK